MIIEYYVKTVYGNDLIYIKDEQLKKIISNLLGKKTINKKDIANFKSLGITFKEVLPPR